MAYHRFLKPRWWVGLCLVVGMCLAAAVQQPAKKSDSDLACEGALAAAHGEKPRYGGKFLSAGNEEISMRQFVLRRLLLAVVTLIGVSWLIFGIMWIMPGDVAVAILGDGANPERVAALREQMGLNDPWYVQYGRWARNILWGDLGTSLFLANKPVKDLIAEHFPITVNLAVYTMTVAVIMGVTLETISGIWHDTVLDYVCRVFSVTSLSVPVFWLGSMLLLTLVRVFAWTPELVWMSPFQDF